MLFFSIYDEKYEVIAEKQFQNNGVTMQALLVNAKL